MCSSSLSLIIVIFFIDVADRIEEDGDDDIQIVHATSASSNKRSAVWAYFTQDSADKN